MKLEELTREELIDKWAELIKQINGQERITKQVQRYNKMRKIERLIALKEGR